MGLRGSVRLGEPMQTLSSNTAWYPSHGSQSPGSRASSYVENRHEKRRRRHTRFKCDWSSDVCSSDLPRASLSLVAPLPVHPQDKLQPVRNRRLKVLILQGGRWLVNWLEWRTRAKEMRNEVRFRNLSRLHGVPSTGFLMPVFDVGRWP